MKIDLVSQLETMDIVRYFVRPIDQCKMLITYNYNQLCVVDITFNVLQSIKVKSSELISYDYVSDDRRHFLWNAEGYCLYYLNINEIKSKPRKIAIPENVSLIQYYVWDEHQFIIVGLGAENTILFFGYNIITHTLHEISYEYVQKKYPFFEVLFECINYNYLLYYDIKKRLLIYRKNPGDEVYLQTSSSTKSIPIQFLVKDVHFSDYLDGVLVLVHKTYVAFYYLETEVFHLTITKDNWAFYSAYLFKCNDELYCLVTQFDLNDPKRNIIEVYKIESSDYCIGD